VSVSGVIVAANVVSEVSDILTFLLNGFKYFFDDTVAEPTDLDGDERAAFLVMQVLSSTETVVVARTTTLRSVKVAELAGLQ
jgi:hypothetical protein